MKYLIFDTETTGFPSKSLSEHDKGQARCVQLSCLLVDSNFKEMASFYSILTLDADKTIQLGAQNAHGISKEISDEYGIEPELAIDLFSSLYSIADCVVAHNIRFDKSVIDIESAVRGYKHIWSKRELCTMDLTTSLCKLQGKIPGKYKWPKLEEAMSILLGVGHTNAHDALGDVKGTANLLKYLIQNGYVDSNNIIHGTIPASSVIAST